MMHAGFQRYAVPIDRPQRRIVYLAKQIPPKFQSRIRIAPTSMDTLQLDPNGDRYVPVK
jgi:hypothetical protein